MVTHTQAALRRHTHATRRKTILTILAPQRLYLLRCVALRRNPHFAPWLDPPAFGGDWRRAICADGYPLSPLCPRSDSDS